MRSPASWPFLLRRLAVLATQAVLITSALLLAFALRFDFKLEPRFVHILLLAIPGWVVAKTVVFRLFSLDRGWWVPTSAVDILILFTGNVVASFAAVGVLFFMGNTAAVPRSVNVIDGILCFGLCAGARVLIVVFRERGPLMRRFKGGARKRTLIYGAGQAGLILIQEIWRNPSLPYHVIGFIDDAAEKRGLRLARVPVLGAGDDLSDIVRRYRVDEVLVAIPSARGDQMARILQNCHASEVDCKTVPGLSEIMLGQGLAGQIREVAVEDLLGRLPVPLDADRIQKLLEQQVVLVTGAGGSIGSELCRQIAKFRPAKIVGFELGETPLYEIDRQMRQCFSDIRFCAEIGSIQDQNRLDEVLARHRPSIVFHAAAYKHVPLMEAHPFEAIQNNVIGSYNLACAAIKAHVKHFVLISTDKAVNPTNVMGATKRLVEKLLLGMKSNTKFVAVRFGNVLGSNGSVIPLFKEQIAAGGPVTVTHEEMRRFFMTIPEACQLVLQATTVAEGGQICVLDMGQPVKIVDLARNLIRLSGLVPDKDIRIEFTGVRPGEKLNEELSSDLEHCRPSSHEKVTIYEGIGHLQGNPELIVSELSRLCKARDAASLLITVKQLVPDYNPSEQILKEALHMRANAHAFGMAGPHLVVPNPNGSADALLQSFSS